MIRFIVGGPVLALTLVALSSSPSVGGGQPEPSVSVPNELFGTYTALAVSKGGKDAPDEFRRDFFLTIDKDGFRFKISGKSYPAKIAKIEPKAKPATLDLAPSEGPEKGKTFLGIYTFNNGELMLAFTEKGERPKDFSGEDDATVMRLRKLEKKAKKN